MKQSKKKLEPYNWIPSDWSHTFKPKHSDHAVELVFYKGRVLISVPYLSEQVEKIKAELGYVLAGSAWLDAEAIDKLIKLLREGKRLFRMHQRDALKVQACKACSKNWCACPKHKKLLKKYSPSTQ